MFKCDVCGASVDDFESCTHEGKGRRLGRVFSAPFSANTPSADFDEDTETAANQAPLNFTGRFGPIAGIVVSALALDAILPIWPRFFAIVAIVFCGPVLVDLLWSAFHSDGHLNFANLFRSIPQRFVTPGIFRMYDNGNNSQAPGVKWLVTLVVAFLLVAGVGTPGNSLGLESQIQNLVKDTIGRDMDFTCPRFFIALPNKTIECNVAVGLGLHLPVDVTFTDILGNYTWTPRL